MALEIEELSGSEENKKKSEDTNQTELILAMQKQISELQNQKSRGNKSDVDIADVLKDLVAGLKEKPDSEKYGGDNFYVKHEDIDPEDLIIDGVPFYCHQVMYVIVDDKRNGHPVRTPFGNTIVFEYQSTRRVKNGKEERLHNISQYVSKSKKEVAWLKQHRGYGSIFFESHIDAMNVDGRKAAKLAKIMAVLQRSDTGKIIKLANQNGITPSQDVDMLRLSIANKQAENEIAAEDAANQIKLRNSIIEKEIIPTKNL